MTRATARAGSRDQAGRGLESAFTPRAQVNRRAIASVFAWLGGLAFVGSLAYFAYFYLVTLGQTDRRGIAIAALASAVLIDLALFGTFAVHHTVMARAGIKRRLARELPPYLERSVYVWIASLLFFATCFWWQPIPGDLYRLAGAGAWLMRGVQVVGLALITSSAASLDSLELAGIRQVMKAWDPIAAGLPASSDRHRAPEVQAAAGPLQVDGPYRLVRHPLYLGWIFFVFGHPTMTSSRFLFAAISTAYLLLAIPWEEQSLMAIYGERYRAYANRVRWRVLPFIY